MSDTAIYDCLQYENENINRALEALRAGKMVLIYDSDSREGETDFVIPAEAVTYRDEFKITSDMANGTACSVVAMVFGNMGNDSGTGVGFTRDPATGENLMFGEYLVNAQGEDVVAGIRTPKPIQEMSCKSLRNLYPADPIFPISFRCW